MRLRGTPLPLVSGSDVDLLVADQVNEDVQLDFKATLYKDRSGATAVPPDKAAIALCKDVTSMANARGGVIVCGMAANKGVASKVVGVAPASIDAEKLWMDAILTQRVQPIIPGILAREVTVASGEKVVLIGVPASLSRPHAFTPAPREPPQWWRRGLAGNLPMDVTDLRALFLEMGTWERDAAEWREERFRRLRNGLGVPRLSSRPTIVVHFQPLGSPRNPITKPPGAPGALPLWLANFLPLQAVGGFVVRPNIDGWLLTVSVPEVATHHVQVFRATGAVEIRMDAGQGLIAGKNTSGHPHLLGVGIERLLARTVKATFLWSELMAVEGPHLVSVRLAGVQNATFSADGIQALHFGDHAIDRQVIDLPNLLVDSPPADVCEAMQSMLDALWQAAGWGESPFRGSRDAAAFAEDVNARTWRNHQ